MKYEIKIPRKIKVGGIDYKIVTGKDVELDLSGTNLAGQACHTSQLIQLSLNTTPQHLHDTILHEVLHAINTVYNHNNLTEDDVTQIAHGLHQVLESMGVRFVL